VTISRFLAADCLDRLHSVVAPLIIGSGRPAISLAPIAHLDAALRPPCRIHPMGEDVLFDFDLRSGPGSPSTST
jgi:diaminohydroxyphosphoribosylaminopyrimidine deaminase/5-amino-6-(5-phosphoribosylamino)uracil reductase